MNYPLKSSGRFGNFGRGGRRGGLSVKKKSHTAVVIAIFFLIFIFVLNMWLPNVLTSTIQSVGRPFWLAENWAGNTFGIDGFLGYFQSKHFVEVQNSLLQSQLNMQAAELQTYSAVAQENEALKEVLGRTDKKDLILSEVLQGPGFSPYDTFVLDSGKNLGIKVGQTVLIDGVLPIGNISQVSQFNSLVSLYSSPGNQVNVIVVASSTPSILVPAMGMGDGNFNITLPRGTIDTASSTINGLHNIEIRLPNITAEILGTVYSEDTDIAHSTDTLYFRSGFDLDSVRQVYVDIDPSPTDANIYSGIVIASTTQTSYVPRK
jgi:hypothetical protein